MPVDVKEDDQLGQKVTDIFSDLYINISKPDIDEDCHQLGKSNTVVRFINRNVCKDALKKKYEVKRLIDNSKLGFKREKNCSSVWVLLPTTSILHGCGGS